jgi:hypothetical protein
MCEDHRLVGSEESVKIVIRQAMWMFLVGLKCHQIDDVYTRI